MLERINGPEDLKELSQDQLTMLAAEIRDVLIDTVIRTGGHLGPNLGVVELTIALHRVFETPKDKFVFDVSHQGYVSSVVESFLALGGKFLFVSLACPQQPMVWYSPAYSYLQS